MAFPDLSKYPEIVVDQARNPGQRHWLTHCTVAMPEVNFPAEVVARSNGNWLAEKALPLFVSEGVLIEQELMPGVHEPLEWCSEDFFSLLHRVGLERVSVALLASLRPIYFFPWPDKVTHWHHEVPGGIMESHDGTYGVAGLREMFEELGIENGRILAHTVAHPAPVANDAGTHVERYSLRFVLCTGNPVPHTGERDVRLKEGIIAINQFPLKTFREELFARQCDGEAVEIFALLASFALEAELKKWP